MLILLRSGRRYKLMERESGCLVFLMLGILVWALAIYGFIKLIT